MSERWPVLKPFNIHSTLSKLSTGQYNHWPPPKKGPIGSNLVPICPLHHQCDSGGFGPEADHQCRGGCGRNGVGGGLTGVSPPETTEPLGIRKPPPLGRGLLMTASREFAEDLSASAHVSRRQGPPGVKKFYRLSSYRGNPVLKAFPAHFAGLTVQRHPRRSALQAWLGIDMGL